MKWEEYKTELKKALDLFEFDNQILTILKDSLKNNQKIFVAGNGGSAAMALHYSNDFSQGSNKNWPQNTKRYQSTCLLSEIGYITAIANDIGYEEIFTQQLINLAKEGDILVLISSSGNSPNIISALKWAKEHKMITIGITGFKGGKLKEACDYFAHVNMDSYEYCEDVHAAFGHFLKANLRE